MNRLIQILILLAILVVAGVVLFDSFSSRVGQRGDNPYEYDIEEYKVVDDNLISYRETRQIEIEAPKAFTYHNGNLYLLSENHLQVIRPDGAELIKKNIDPNPSGVVVSPEGVIFVAFRNYLVSYTQGGQEIDRSTIQNEESLYSSLTLTGNTVFVADAGKKEVLVFDRQLHQSGSFKGESGVSAAHGFILPSAHFHMAVNASEELWVVNPGLHRIQNYALNGRLRGDWGKPSFSIEGFSGCCNPSYFAFLSDGRFVTSEKGMVRVKIYKESGELESVVAAPESFPNGEKAPAVAIDDNDNIWLLDYDKKMLRLFSPV